MRRRFSLTPSIEGWAWRSLVQAAEEYAAARNGKIRVSINPNNLGALAFLWRSACALEQVSLLVFGGPFVLVCEIAIEAGAGARGKTTIRHTNPGLVGFSILILVVDPNDKTRLKPWPGQNPWPGKRMSLVIFWNEGPLASAGEDFDFPKIAFVAFAPLLRNVVFGAITRTASNENVRHQRG